ncbi:MAG TPA: hypothetical protein VM557_04700, partial [Thermoanaerobaculia bacterium]|nr:hypothetical protein [Thermoanaerobaculia bacterium]
PIDLDMDLRHRAEAHDHWVGGRLSAALASWEAQRAGPQNSLESAMVAEALADDERPDAELWIDLHEMQDPIEAAAIRGRLRWRQRRLAEAAAELEKAFVGYRTNAWPMPQIMRRALIIAEFTAAEEPELAPRLWASVSEPFAVKMMDEQRRKSAIAIARRMPGGECNQTVIRALEGFEPWFPWDESLLRLRLRCHGEVSSVFAGAAFRDLADYMKEQPETLLLK